MRYATFGYYEGYDIETPEIDAFLVEIEAVCRKHGFSISHQDGQGAFEIDKFNEDDMRWLHKANDVTRTG